MIDVRKSSRKNCSPELELGLRGHVSGGVLPGPALGVFGLRGVPCWSKKRK